MNIHLWSPGFHSAPNGITAFSNELASGLSSAGHELRLFGKADAPAFSSTPAFGARILISCALHRPDHIISAHLNFGPAVRWAHRALGTSYSLVCHGIDVDPALSPSRRKALRAAEQIIAVSEWTRQRVLDLGGIDPARVKVLPNTFDEARFTVGAKPAALLDRYGLRDDEKVVLTVGRLDSAERYKGYDRVLRALPAIQEACGPVRYLVAGRGDDRARLETMARELGVQDAVTFTGFVPVDELADHYRLADVFAMPSTGEGFGIVFLETMSCGTPVLAGNRDGSVDALDGGRLGLLVDPLEVTAIAGGVISLLSRQGPALWFDRNALHDAVSQRFGRAVFRKTLDQLFPRAAA